MKTKNGIYTDLKESEYTYIVLPYRFVFSSLFYLEKFRDNHYDYVNEQIEKFRIRNKVEINHLLCKELSKVYLISLYKQIEKRGYRVIDLTTNKEI